MAPPSIHVSLRGPPEIHQQPSLDAAAPTASFTANGSPTFQSTGNPCLDFFFHAVPDTPPEALIQRLELAWKHDPLKTLKLLCNLRGVRGTGKSDKEGGYTAALWLHRHHPKTLACNVASFAEFGYSKDLLEILFRILEGPDARKLAKEAYAQWKQRKAAWESAKEARKLKKQRIEMRKMQAAGGGHVYNGWNRFNAQVLSHTIPSNATDNVPKETEPKFSREEKRIQRAKKVFERFNRDPDFKFLHERVSDYFAECLRSDVKMLSSGDSSKISLAAKWCPSLDSSYDKTTLLCESIARKVFPRDECPEYEGVEDAHYAYRVRDRLRKEVLVPLHKALELPEVYMGANDWSSLPYGRVASVAMKTYQSKFYKHDGHRFKAYLDKVRMGDMKIAAGALLPHEIIASLDEYDCDGSQVAELQWERMVSDMSKKGILNNCMAICDVSGSMNGTPMEVSVALGVLVSELSEEPWKGKLITFSQNPKLQTIQGSSLKEKTHFVRKMEWGMNTDFQKVFDLLLEVAVNGKLKPDQMIKRLFVFSDMEFDQANATTSNHYSYPVQQPIPVPQPQHISVPQPQPIPVQPALNPIPQRPATQPTPMHYPYPARQPTPMHYPYPGTQPTPMHYPYPGTQPTPIYPNTTTSSWGTPIYPNTTASTPMHYHYPGAQPTPIYPNTTTSSWETDYQAIVRKFTESGYGDCVPEIVFWNLRDSKATPVLAKQPGVALVSGYSKNLMSVFVKKGDISGPEAVMDDAISGDEYKKLVVLD